MSEDIWTSLISVDRLDLQDTSERGAVMSRCGFRSVRYLELKIRRFGTKDSVRCSEFRDGHFSEVANVLQVWNFQSVTRTLSAL